MGVVLCVAVAVEVCVAVQLRVVVTVGVGVVERLAVTLRVLEAVGVGDWGQRQTGGEKRNPDQMTRRNRQRTK